MKKYNYEDDDNIKNLNINESIENNNKKLYISGGIDPERIINKEYISPLGDFYKCSICFKIMLDAKDCEECGHSYCYECISVLNCPFGCKTKSIKNTSIGIINLLKNLKFKCKNEGCTAIIPYDEVKNHDLNCEYQKVSCTNKRCKKRIIKHDLDNHIKNICKYTLVKCQYCKSEYLRKEIKYHEKLCSIIYKYIEKYKKENNLDDINNIINDLKNVELNERYFNKYLQNLSINISKILQENKLPQNQKEQIISKNEDNNEKKNENNKPSEIKYIDNFDNKKNKKIEETKELVPQIEEDDLLYIFKKALEEKIRNKFSKYDINFLEFCHELNIIKGSVCQLNIIQEVEESDEDEEEEKEITTKIKPKKKNINNNENNIINIKENLKQIIDNTEIKIKLHLKQLSDSILSYIKTNIINLDNIKKEENPLNIKDIDKKLDDFISQINDCIKDTNTNISNIYKQINDEATNIKNKYNNIEIQEINEKNNINNQLKKILQNIIEKNKNKNLNDILNNKDNKIKEIYEEKNNLIKEEINKTLNGQNDLITNEIVKLSQEIETIKEYINSIKTLLINRTNDLGNIIKFTTQNEDNNNILEDIIFNAFNQPKIFFRSRMKSTKTIQAKKADLKKINKKINSNIRAKSLEKKFNSTTEHLPTINMIKDQRKMFTRSFSFNSVYFRDPINASINKEQETDLLSEKISKIENQIKDIYNNLKDVPEKLNENITKDVLNYFDKLKEIIDKNLAEKIKDKFRLKFCEECQKVEYFYCFKDCSNCKIEYCINNIILCRICKQFICKNCYHKVHKCN